MRKEKACKYSFAMMYPNGLEQLVVLLNLSKEDQKLIEQKTMSSNSIADKGKENPACKVFVNHPGMVRRSSYSSPRILLANVRSLINKIKEPQIIFEKKNRLILLALQKRILLQKILARFLIMTPILSPDWTKMVFLYPMLEEWLFLSIYSPKSDTFIF